MCRDIKHLPVLWLIPFNHADSLSLCVPGSFWLGEWGVFWRGRKGDTATVLHLWSLSWSLCYRKGREGRDFPSEPSSHSLRRHRAAPETISSVCSEMDRSDSSDQNCSPPLIRTILRVQVVGNVSGPIRSNNLVQTQICWQPVDSHVLWNISVNVKIARNIMNVLLPDNKSANLWFLFRFQHFNVSNMFITKNLQN